MLLVIIDKIFPEKTDLSVGYSYIFWRFYMLRVSFLKFWMTCACFYVNTWYFLRECNYNFQIFLCYLFGFYVFYYTSLEIVFIFACNYMIIFMFSEKLIEFHMYVLIYFCIVWLESNIFYIYFIYILIYLHCFVWILSFKERKKSWVIWKNWNEVMEIGRKSWSFFHKNLFFLNETFQNEVVKSYMKKLHERVACSNVKLHETTYSEIYPPSNKLLVSHQFTRIYWGWSTYKMSSSRNISRKWWRDEVILFLELYYGFPILWNVHSSDYKKRNIRKIYVIQIQEGLSTIIAAITIEDIKEKLHKLRTQYQMEHIKIKSSSRIGVGLDDVHKSRL